MDKFNKFIKNVLVFFAIFLVINYVMETFFPGKELPPEESNTLVFETTKKDYSRTKVVTLHIKNNTSETIKIPNECPNEPFDIFRYEGNEWIQKEANPELDCSESKSVELEPGKQLNIPYSSWNYALFGEMGRFRIQFTQEIEGDFVTYTTPEFTIEKEGIVSQLWRAIIYKPIYNGLIYLTSVIPGHNLGLAIIILTLIIRTILLLPSQKAIRSQQKMQEIQPRLDKIKEKYKGDQQKIAMETMAIWKESGVKPMGSCLPLLLQFPFLIGIYYVVRDGLNPDNIHLLYNFISNYHISDINTYFLGLDLRLKNLYVLPLIIGGLQFIQMKLTLTKKPTKNGDGGKKNELAMAQNMMIYIMPVMIAVFTASLPSGVGIYWGTSTLYGIVQQLIVMRVKPSKKEEPTVRVIEKSK
jgi:YidC/Oxa1 family membrane protein insertase